MSFKLNKVAFFHNDGVVIQDSDGSLIKRNIEFGVKNENSDFDGPTLPDYRRDGAGELECC